MKIKRKDRKATSSKRRGLVAGILGFFGGTLISIIPRRSEAAINIPPEVAQGARDGFQESIETFFEKWTDWMGEQPEEKREKNVPAAASAGQAVMGTLKDVHDSNIRRSVGPMADPCNDGANPAATGALEKSSSAHEQQAARQRVANIRAGVL